MKSAYAHRFWLRLAEATRTGWACLGVAAILLYVRKIQGIASVPVLAPVLAVLLAGPPLGTVLQNSVGILTVSLPALASTIAVLQVFRPPISRFAAIACTGVSSYLIAYLSETHLLGRKMALAQVSIVYVTAHYTPDMDVVFYPLKMIFPEVLGVVVAIIATIFPIPRLAVLEARQSAKSAARGLSEFFKAMVKTISAPDASTFGSMNLHAAVLAKASKESLTDLKKKQVDIWWELGACGAKGANKRFTKGLDCLNLHLTGMEMALESGHILDTPAPLRGTLQGAFMKVVDQCQLLLDSADKGLLWLPPTKIGRICRQKLIEDGKETLNLFDRTYVSAREQAYYTYRTETASRAETDELEPWHDYRISSKSSDPSFVRRKFRGRVSMLFFIFNMRLYFMEAINLVAAGHHSANKMHQILRIGPTVAGLEQTMNEHCSKTQTVSEDSSSDSTKNSRKLSGSVFLRPGDPSLDASWPSARISSNRLSRNSSAGQSSHRGAVFDEDCLPQMMEGDHENADPGPADCVKQPSVHRQCSHSHAVAMEKTISKASGSSSWKVLRRLGIKPSKTQSKRSLKTSLSMILATTFGIVVLEHKAQSFWAPVTVGFIIGNFQGGSWRISNLRLQGTVLGSIYGFLALSASHNHKWAILLLLVPWVIFSSFIRYSPAYGYSGLVSAFTAAILMLGGYHADIKQFAMDRITETFVGIACFVFVETVVFPERAVVLVRQELVSSLVSLRDCVGAIVTVYTEQDCLHCRGLAVMEIKQLEQRLRASFAKQSILCKEAALEPDLWFVPFPADVYSKLIAIQGRMLDLLFFMVCSLHATTEECLTEQIETLLQPLRTSLTALQEEVLDTIDSLQELLQEKIVQENVLHQLKRWLQHCARRNTPGDVEQPEMLHPHPHHPLLVLGHRHRSVDGIPTNLKSTMDSFEHSFEDVLENLIATTRAEENKQMLNSSVMLSVGSLSFSLHSLLKETVHLEKAVHELLQAESPWSVLDFWNKYTVPGSTHDPAMAARR